MDLQQATAFLYTGPNAQQVGVAPGTIIHHRVGVIRGRALNSDQQGIAGVLVRILNHSEYGMTTTDSNGVFSMAVNAGDIFTVDYEADGFLSVQRTQYAPALDYAFFPDVTLTALDPARTAVDLSSGDVTVAQATPSTDDDGTRQSVLMFLPGTQATIVNDDGTTAPLSNLTVHSTEYTVGPHGQQAMPAPLPPLSGYTYAVDLEAEEATGNGVTKLTFNQPVVNYVDNFLHFPVGSLVPVGYYDRAAASWVPAPNGRVIQVLDTVLGVADIDGDGDGVADTTDELAALGITDQERASIAALYVPGDSLWRVPVAHFSIYDYNWPVSPPLDATPPPDPNPTPDNSNPPGDCHKKVGSTISCTSQVLEEQVNVVGAPFSLHYTSARSPAYGSGLEQATAVISGPTVPASLARIDVRTVVAGQVIAQSYPPSPGQKATVTWNGQDGYGRSVSGRQPATVAISYVYNGVYNQPRAEVAQAFGGDSEVPAVQFGGDRARGEITLSRQGTVNLEAPNAAVADGFGGWSVDIHHLYDPRTFILTRGDGQDPSSDALGGRAAASLTTVPASVMPPAGLEDFKLGSDGTIYTAGMTTITNGQIAAFRPDGSTTVIASNIFPSFLALYGPTIYFADLGNPFESQRPTTLVATQIVKVNSDGSTSVVAGSRSEGCTLDATGAHAGAPFAGDGGPAIDACLEDIIALQPAPDGTLYVLARGPSGFPVLQAGSLIPYTVWRLRQITADGNIHTVLSGGVSGDPTVVVEQPSYFAQQFQIGNDYTIYLVALKIFGFDQTRGLITGESGTLFEKILPDGELSLLAGSESAPTNPCASLNLASVVNPTSCGINGKMVDTYGNIFGTASVGFFDPRFSPPAPEGAFKVVRIRDDGTAEEAYAGLNLNVNSFFPPIFGSGGSMLVLNSPFVGASEFNYWGPPVLTRLQAPFPSVSEAAAYTVPSGDGSEIYIFDSQGRHQTTLDGTGTVTKFQFAYDSHGYLSQITDRDGLVTSIVRDGSGAPTGIVAPTGQITTLGLDAAGNLASVTSPAGALQQFQYSNGAMVGEIDARGGNHVFTYDDSGRLTGDQTPMGGQWTLTPEGSSIASQSPTGVIEAHTVSEPTGMRLRTATDGAGLTSSSLVDAAGNSAQTMADGTVVQRSTTQDPRFGFAAPFLASESIATPGGLVYQSSASRAAVIGSDGVTLSSQTDTTVVNGQKMTTSYDGSSRTTTTTSPAGRQSVVTQDDHGRTVFSQVGTLAPSAYSYDSRGRLASVTAGVGAPARVTSFSYDGQDRPVAWTDSLSQTSAFGYDADNRVTSQTTPDGAQTTSFYAPAGDLVSLTPPGETAHQFTYTPAGDEATYTAPAVPDAASSTTSYAYNLDRQLTLITRPDGKTVSFTYDGAGRQSTTTYDAGTVTRLYSPTTGQLVNVAATDGGTLDLSYDGSLLLSTAWSGVVSGTVSRTWNNDLRVATESVNGGNTVAFTYDPDGLVIGAGTMSVARDPATGLITGTTLGGVTDTRGHNLFGERTSITAAYNGTALFDTQDVLDNIGRVTGRTETTAGVSHIYGYSYDPAGRLTQIVTDGTTTAAFTYDANGNRLSNTTVGGTELGTYDGQDRLLTYGRLLYTYTANGELATKTDSSTGQVTTYGYDGFGNLRSVSLPDGRLVEYVIDGMNRRIGKKIDGVLVKGWLYGSRNRVVAELDGNGNVVSRFSYIGNDLLAAYIVNANHTYRVLGDEVGTPRIVVDVSSGTIVQSIETDAFGVVTADTNPGFQPFGLAGGNYDSDTGLVKFGARDYDPFSGRWIEKDPIGFAGGQANMFLYVDGDPINRVDPFGQDWFHYMVAQWLIMITGDFDTEPDSSVFYSGYENFLAAMRFARCEGKQTIFDTQGGQFLQALTTDWESSRDLEPDEVTKLWETASKMYAQSASGSVSAFVDGADLDMSVWARVELHNLEHNNGVSIINYYPTSYTSPCGCGN